ncbi:hypothetical protein ACLOJK_006129 [Asimina triloba]
MASSLGPGPLLLKDFLRDDPHSSYSDDFLSCSMPSDTTVRQLLEVDLGERDPVGAKRLQRSRSRAAAATTISAIQRASDAVANAIKLLPFSSTKSPAPSSRPKESTLRRSFSKKLRRSFWKKIQREELGSRVRTRVRDEQSEKKRTKPLDPAGFFSSISSVNTVTASRRSSSSSSGRSSWSESDFTVRSSSGSSVYSGENEGYDGKNAVPAEKSRSRSRAVGGDSMGTATCCREAAKVGEGKEEPGRPYEEQEQLSPVSVLDFPYEDDETLPSPSSSAFQQSLANVERTKQQLLQKIRRFECLAELDHVDLEKRLTLSEQDDEQGNDFEDEEEEDDRPTKLLEQFKASCYGQHEKPHLKKTTTTTTDRLLLAFFRECLSLSSSSHGGEEDELEMGLLRDAMNWVNGGSGKTAWGAKVRKEIHVREMEKGGRWSKFEDEEGELAAELEVGLVGSLLEELLLDLLA